MKLLPESGRARSGRRCCTRCSSPNARRAWSVNCVTSERRPMPERLWKALADAGVFGLLLPEEYGGAGGDAFRPGRVLRGSGPRPVSHDRAHHFAGRTCHPAAGRRRTNMRRGCPSLAAGKICATTSLWRPRDAAVDRSGTAACPAGRRRLAAERRGRLRRRRQPGRSLRRVGSRRRGQQTLGFVVALPR